MATALVLALTGCGAESAPEGAPPDNGTGSGGDQAGTDGSAESGDSADQAPAGDFDPGHLCDLLDTSEIEAQFGDYGEVEDGVWSSAAGRAGNPSGPHYLKGCEWEVGGDPGDPGWLSVIIQHEEIPRATVKEAFDEYRNSLGEPVGIDGLGDEAFLLETGELIGFRKGEVFLTVSIYTFDTTVDDLTGELSIVDGLSGKLTTLVELVLDRL